MPILYAVFIAIDSYPNPDDALEGCVADMKHFYNYIDTCCTQLGFELRPLVLTEEQAVRSEVIAAFEHFRPAETGDQCLFFYAGHGARHDAPEMFWALESDKKIESIVCWDSRQPGGYDLMDKELSYLIWNVMKGKDMPMVTITDCCHSGRMRNMKHGKRVKNRNLLGLSGAVPPGQYIGWEHYSRDANGQVGPRLARRIHLAAARDTEMAQEIAVGGTMRGIFTSCLVSALETAESPMSYAELMRRVQMRVRANIPGQSPQLETTFDADKNLRFLTVEQAGTPSYLVRCDSQFGWIIDAGAVQGIQAGDPDHPTVLELKADKSRIVVKETMPNVSIVGGMGNHDPKQTYTAVIVRHAWPALTIVPAPDSDAAAIAVLQQQMERFSSNVVRLGAAGDVADFMIRTDGGAFVLTHMLDDIPVSPSVFVHSVGAAKTFLSCLTVIAHWHRLLRLSNAATAIREEDIAIALYRPTEPGNYRNDVSVQPVVWKGITDFNYLLKDGIWHQPAFQLKIRNNGRRPLWVSLLYLGANFSITNQLLAKKYLASGEEEWIQDILDDEVFRTIKLEFEPTMRQKGLTSLKEYMKLIVSTEELNTDMFNQEGLDFNQEGASTTRDVQFRSWGQPARHDWNAYTIELNIIYDTEPEAG